MSLRNKFATALLATTALVASNAQAGQTIANEDEVRALSASCEQAVIWYGDKLPHPEIAIERFAQSSAKNRDVNITTVAGNPAGNADVYICSGKSNKDYTSPLGTDAIDDAASVQNVVKKGLSGHHSMNEVITSIRRTFEGAQDPTEQQITAVQHNISEDNLIAQNAPKL